MINIKKGTGLSLQQSDRVGTALSGQGVVAGMVVRLDTSGNVVVGPTNAAAADDLLGFALNNQTDSDVIASGKIGYIHLDGSSVIETDQVTGTINSTNFVLGARVSADPSSLGNVRAWQSGDRVLGYVDGIRTLPGISSVSQNYQNIAGSTLTNTSNQQVFVTVLAIKLAI